MEEIITATDLLIPIKVGEKILRDKPFIIIDEQILYRHEDSNLVVFTQISEDKEYTIDDCMCFPENAPYELI
jgi:hypothetical protein